MTKYLLTIGVWSWTLKLFGYNYEDKMLVLFGFETVKITSKKDD